MAGLGKFIELKNLSSDTANPDFVFLNKKEAVFFKEKQLGYTSPTLNKLILSNLNEKNEVDKTLIKLIKAKVIIFFMYFDNNQDLQTWKILPSNKYIKAVWGWYVGKTNGNKIFISINSMQQLDGMIISRDAINLIVHELMHLAFANFKDFFINNFGNILIDFYHKFIHKYFEIKDPEKINKQHVRILLDEMINNELDESSNYFHNYPTSIAEKLLLFNEKGLSNVNKKVEYISYLLMNSSNIYHILKKKDKYKLQPALHEAYIHILKKYTDINNPQRPPNFVFQELLYPSEVIAVFSQFDKENNYIKKMMEYIRMNTLRIAKLSEGDYM